MNQTERTKKNKYRMSPAQRAEHTRKRNEASSRRYWYMVNEMGVERWKARLARGSVTSMLAWFPKHKFPPELIELGTPGPKRGAKYDLTGQKPLWQVLNEHGAVAYEGLYRCEAELIAKNRDLNFRMRI